MEKASPTSLIHNLLYQLFVPISVVVLLATGLWQLQSSFDPPEALKLSPLLHNTTDQQSAAIPKQGWQKITLPHDWRSISNSQQKVVWYQTKVDQLTDAALYIPHVNSYLTVWVNDQLFATDPYIPEKSHNQWNHPRWIPLGDLQQGDTLTLKVKTDQPGYGMLGTAYLGNQEALANYYQGWQRFHITFLEYVSAAMLLTALFMAFIWYFRRDESVFGFAAAFLLVWFFHNLQLFVTELPVARSLVDWYAKLTLCWMVIFIIIFLHRLLGEKPTTFEKVLVAYGIGSSCLTFALAFIIPDQFWLLTSRYWDSLTLIMGAYPTYRVVRATILRKDKTIMFTAMAGTLIVAFGGHDWLMVNMGLPREKGYLIHYSAVVAMTVFGAILLQRFVSAINVAEQLNKTLEARIETAKDKIERQFEKVQQLQKEQTLAEERERIMRDMHDGIGGHLVSCISIVESQPENTEAIADILRTSLLDLRLMIDSFEPSSKDILSMLAMLRERTEQQLQLVNIQYDWQVRDFSSDIEFPPDITLQILRILQEAITNVLKHAKASRIKVRTYEEQADGNTMVAIEISDNGIGFDQDQPRQGYGITNMQKRAARINAELAINSNDQGSVFTLKLSPLAIPA